MTTDTELRDLLRLEAAAPNGPGADWDQIVRRGRHHRRVARVRTGIAASGLAALALIAVVAGTDLGDEEGQGVVANQPDAPTTLDSTPVTTPISTPVTDPGGEPADGLYGPQLSGARSLGTRVTVLTAPADPPSGFDPCAARHPRVTETATEVVVELVDASLSTGQAWVECQASPFSGWGTLELAAPLGERRLVDATTGTELTAVDGAALLFPTALPDPFDLQHWDEFTAVDPRWTFSFSAADQVLSLAADTLPGCPVASALMTIRGHEGSHCSAENGPGTIVWQEGGHQYSLEWVDVGGNPLSATVADLLAIAEDLEPLG